MPINITEEFVCSLIEQNAALIAQGANLSETVESLNQTIKDLQEQLNKIYLGTLISFSTKWVLNSYVDFKYMEEELARKFFCTGLSGDSEEGTCQNAQPDRRTGI